MRKNRKRVGAASTVLPEMVLPERLFQYHAPMPQVPVLLILLLAMVALAITPDVSMPQSKTLAIVFPEMVSPLSSPMSMPSSVSVWCNGVRTPSHLPSMTLSTIRLSDPNWLTTSAAEKAEPRVWLTMLLFENTTRFE